ncbi:MAG: hypothetical protein Q9165_008135 [Trypethelium subeluteriae]
MGPDNPLPLPSAFVGKSAEEFTDSLLNLTTSSTLLQNLCGGVHVLDFFAKEPDLYSSVLPKTWREWFKKQSIMDILDVLMRKDLPHIPSKICDGCLENRSQENEGLPPLSLIEYIRDIRAHSLAREFPTRPVKQSHSKQGNPLSRDVVVGMKIKKIEEVSHFACYVNQLTTELAATQGTKITHLVDFGSGQNYLGRALASEPYNRNVIALESKPHNIIGAKKYDETARLTEKSVIVRDKKRFRAEQQGLTYTPKESMRKNFDPDSYNVVPSPSRMTNTSTEPLLLRKEMPPLGTSASSEDRGSIQYIEFLIKDGDLEPVLQKTFDQSSRDTSDSNDANGFPLPQELAHDPASKLLRPIPPHLLIISLHSCGNLVHHGLRALLLNPRVAAVALVGCCYNLVTERLSPPTYKLPSLRTRTPRLEQTSTACDPHGFPMSERLCKYEHARGKGIRLNITARMMAVQAPQNWGADDSERFFTRHFYRALLQRIFLDYGVVEMPGGRDGVGAGEDGEGNEEGRQSSTSPIILGSLKKSCYVSFLAYVRGALDKLSTDSEFGRLIQEKLGRISDEEIQEYGRAFQDKKHEISVLWSLMAFSAGVVEAVMVVDRWLFLKEQECVERCWVEPVFSYRQSPRNLVVVGVKKPV